MMDDEEGFFGCAECDRYSMQVCANADMSATFALRDGDNVHYIILSAEDCERLAKHIWSDEE